MGSSRLLSFAVCVCACAPLAAGAQDSGSSRIETELRVSGFYTDNFYYDTTGSTAKDSASGALVAPRLAYRGSSGPVDLGLGVQGEYGTFDAPGTLDDYTDGKAFLDFGLLASSRSNFNLHAGYDHGHDPFGTNRTEDATVRNTDLDIWNNASGIFTFHFGTPEARLNAEVALSGLAHTYQTNRPSTQYLDYDTRSVQYTLLYNYSPKTAGLVDFVRSGVKFDEPFPSMAGVDTRNGDEYRIRAGARWLASAKTSGDVRVGYYDRSFDNTLFTDKGLDWQAGIHWAPLARTVLDLTSTRGSEQSYRDDTSVIITRSVALNWTQNWTARTSSSLHLGTTDSNFRNSAASGNVRSDTLYNAGLGVSHTLTQYLAVFVGVDVFNRDSNDPSSEYNRFSSYLGIRLGR